jgi:hypothetical protein
MSKSRRDEAMRIFKVSVESLENGEWMALVHYNVAAVDLMSAVKIAEAKAKKNSREPVRAFEVSLLAEADL